MMRLLVVATLIAVLAFVAFSAWTRLSPTKAVSDARPASDLAPRPGRLVVDIREPSEWRDTGVLPGVRLHSWRSAEAFSAAFRDDLTDADEILILCRSGNRSSKAARALASHLDREVVDIAGGMIRLAREGQAQVVAPSREMGCTVC